MFRPFLFFLLSQSFLHSLAYAQSQGEFGEPNPRGHARIEGLYSGGQSKKQWERQINAGTSVYKTETDTWYFDTKHSETYIGQNELKVGKNETAVGGHLHDHSYFIGYNHKDFDQRGYGFILGYGSASDKPFGADRDKHVNATATYTASPSEGSQWVLLLNYSTNRVFLNGVPLPGFIYIYRPNNNFVLTAGFPFLSVTWIDWPKYNVTFYLTPASVGTDAAVGILGPVQAYTQAYFKIKGYAHHNRIENFERLYLEEKRAMLGMRSPLARWLSTQIGAGYSFDRMYYESKSIYKVTSTKRRLASDFVVEAKLTARF